MNQSDPYTLQFIDVEWPLHVTIYRLRVTLTRYNLQTSSDPYTLQFTDVEWPLHVTIYKRRVTLTRYNLQTSMKLSDHYGNNNNNNNNKDFY